MPKAEFVCNMPCLTDDETILSLYPGCSPSIMVEISPHWRRVGHNLVGPPYGDDDCLDIGIYYAPKA